MKEILIYSTVPPKQLSKSHLSLFLLSLLIVFLIHFYFPVNNLFIKQISADVNRKQSSLFPPSLFSKLIFAATV